MRVNFYAKMLVLVLLMGGCGKASEDAGAKPELAKTTKAGDAKTAGEAKKPEMNKGDIIIKGKGVVKSTNVPVPKQKIIPTSAALDWLARHQEPDGSWAVNGIDPAKSKLTDIGLTGICVLAFQKDGQTERVGKHKAVVKKAIEFLKSKQNVNGFIGEKPAGEKPVGDAFDYKHFHNHVIANLALSESYALAKIKATGEAAQRGYDYFQEIYKEHFAGMKYNPEEADDLYLIPWCLYLLGNAKHAKWGGTLADLEIATNYLDTVDIKVEEKDRHLKAAAHLACSIYIEMKRTDPKNIKKADLIIDNLPKWDGSHNKVFTYSFFSSKAMYDMRGKHWKAWNSNLRKFLFDKQIASSDLKLDGSWPPISDAKNIGRAYSTAMGVLNIPYYYCYYIESRGLSNYFTEE